MVEGGKKITKREFLALAGLFGLSMIGCGFEKQNPILVESENKDCKPLSGQSGNIKLPEFDEILMQDGYDFMLVHNMAFYVWLRDRLKYSKIEKNKKYCGQYALFHIDAHHDLGYASDFRSFVSRDSSTLVSEISRILLPEYQKMFDQDLLLRLARAEAEEMFIGNFVPMALLSGIFDHVYWVRPYFDFKRFAQPTLRYGHIRCDSKARHPETDCGFLWERKDKNEDYDVVIEQISIDQIPSKAKNHDYFFYGVDLDYLSCSKNPIYKVEIDQIYPEIVKIKQIKNELGNRVISSSCCVSPSCLFKDQINDLVDSFFSY